jgi:hypothetical protein
MSKVAIRYVYFAATSTLGLYRGISHYKHNYSLKMDKYEKNKYYDKPIFFYYHMIAQGVCGIFLYVNPITLMMMLPKEIYRLEVNLRNLEDEKKTDYYNDIF